MNEAQILTAANWRDAVAAALEELPEDIKTSVGYSHPGEKEMQLTIAGHPLDDENGESYVSSVKIRWWNTVREQGWPPQHASLYGPGGMFEERAE